MFTDFTLLKFALDSVPLALWFFSLKEKNLHEQDRRVLPADSHFLTYLYPP